MRREPEPAAHLIDPAAAYPKALIALLAAEERVRAEAADALHGKVQGGLAVVALLLAECRRLAERGGRTSDTTDAKLSESLREASERLDAVRHGELEGTIGRLYPTAIRLGLLPALDVLLEPYRRQLRVSLTADARTRALDDPVGEGLPPEVRLAAYRTVEAALDCLDFGAKGLDVELCLQGVCDAGSANGIVESLSVRVARVSGAGGAALALEQSRKDSDRLQQLAALRLRVEIQSGRLDLVGPAVLPTAVTATFPLTATR